MNLGRTWTIVTCGSSSVKYVTGERRGWDLRIFRARRGPIRGEMEHGMELKYSESDKKHLDMLISEKIEREGRRWVKRITRDGTCEFTSLQRNVHYQAVQGLFPALESHDVIAAFLSITSEHVK